MTFDVIVIACNSRDHCALASNRSRELRTSKSSSWKRPVPRRSLEVVAELPVRVVDVGRNAGFAAGCNAGARAGSGEALLFLNPDAQIEPESLRRLASVLEEDETCAVVGPHVVGDSGEKQILDEACCEPSYSGRPHARAFRGPSGRVSGSRVVRNVRRNSRALEAMIGVALCRESVNL